MVGLAKPRGLRLIWVTCVLAVVSVVAVLLVPTPFVSAAPNPGECQVVVDDASATLTWGEIAGISTIRSAPLPMTAHRAGW